jgi:amino acid adenylation domain-containing protein
MTANPGPQGATGPAPLSLAQEQLWLLDLLAGPSALHNVAVAFRVHGMIDATALEWAVNEVARRHPALRTRFITVNGEPRQVSDPGIHIPVIRPARGRPDAEVIGTAARQRFDLAKGPLLQVVLTDSDSPHLLFVAHHLVIDGWSLEILGAELSLFYRQRIGATPAQLPEPPLVYSDYAVRHRTWLASPQAKRQLSDYASDLRGFPMVPVLPTDRPRRAVRTFAGAEFAWQVPASTTTGLRRTARQHRATLFMVLLTGYVIVLARWSEQSRLLVGSPMACRVRRDTESLIGYFVNTVVIPADLTGNPALADLLTQVRAQCLRALSRRELPFGQLVEALAPERSPAYNPVVQMTMTLQDAPALSLDLPGAVLERSDPGTGVCALDIELDIVPDDDRLDCAIRYPTDLFDRASIERFSRHLGRAWECLAADLGRAVRDVDLLDDDDHKLLRRLGTGPEWPAETQALPRRLAAALDRNPVQTAIEAPDGSYSRSELAARAARITGALAAADVAPGDLVGVALGRGRDLPAALLGVWGAGAAYVPMDPEYPAERLTYMAENSGITALVTVGTLAERLPRFAGLTIIDLDQTVAESPAGWSPPQSRNDDLAYVIYTSGSTGRPKGVMIEQRSLANVLDAFSLDPGFAPDDRMLALTSLSFDISGLELFLPLLVGGTVIIAPEGTGGDPARLHALLEKQRATVVQATPATWKLYTAFTAVAPPGLRQIWSGGEYLPHWLAQALTKLGPVVHNLYGPTETTIWSTCATLTSGDKRTGIGRPVDNTRLHVVDEYGKPVPPGVPGELWISGNGVARGYLGRPELTSERFALIEGKRAYRTGDVVRWGSDGTLEYLQRADHQVKVRGHRIEPGEIDAAALGLPGVRDACTVVRPAAHDDIQLVTYIVPKSACPSSETARSLLAEVLPAYMMPALIVPLDALPLTPNGKIDRNALPSPAPARRDAEEPTTATERTLAAIWCDVLEIAEVGRTDDFFAVGGHSLSATRVTGRVLRDLGVDLDLADFFANPRLQEMAVRIDALAADGQRAGNAVETIRTDRARYRMTTPPSDPTPEVSV